MSNSIFIHSMTLGALLLGAAALPPSAQAQSCGDTVSLVHSSYPADGAMGVPTNAPLFIYGPELEVGAYDITLQDVTGDAPPFEEEATDGGLYVEAYLGLKPNMTYELTVASRAGNEEWSTAFTTGTGPAILVQLRAPDVLVSVIEQDRGTCGGVPAICVIGSAPPTMTLEVLVGEEVLSLGGGQPAPAYTASGGSIAANDCIDVRVREPGGAVSNLKRFCGSAIQRFELAANAPAPSSCQPYGSIAVEPESSSSDSDSGGCAMGAPGAASGAGGLLFGLSALLAARWRRSPRCRRK